MKTLAWLGLINVLELAALAGPLVLLMRGIH
jgi:hypothetical protein